MTLKEKLKWEGAIANRLEAVQTIQKEFASRQGTKFDYYLFVSETFRCAIERYVEGEAQNRKRQQSWSFMRRSNTSMELGGKPFLHQTAQWGTTNGNRFAFGMKR